MYQISKAFLVALACVLNVAHAGDAYPARPIRMVVPWSAGGSTDLLGRTLAEGMGRNLGVSIVVENKPGATGTIGYAQAARSAGDGYTLLLGTNSTFAIAPHFYRNLPYNANTDFVAIGMIGSNQQVLCANPTSGINSVADLLQRAKQRPGEISYSSSGVGGSSHLGTELLMSIAGINLLHVPYKGGAPALQAIVSGEAQIGFVDISVARPMISGGKLRPLGTSGSARAPLLPNVPTLAEAGVTGFESLTTFGLFVPATTAKDIVARLNSALKATLMEAVVAEKLSSMGFEPLGGNAQGNFKAYANEETQKWGSLIKQRSIKLQ